jgi:chemotaxis protein CheX
MMKEIPVQPVDDEIRNNLLVPFVAATRAALGEMAGVEIDVRAVSRQSLSCALGDIAAVVAIRSAPAGSLVVGFSERTAAALARRILGEVTSEVDESLVRDCMGEIANVIVGQAKAMLAESTFQIVFSLPQIVINSSEFRSPPDLNCFVMEFNSECGDFNIQLFLHLPV